MSTWSEIRARKQPRETTVVLALDDDDVLDELDRARAALAAAEARSTRVPENDDAQAALAAARQRLDDASDAAAEHTVEFRLRSIGRAAYEELVTEHPAEKDRGTSQGAHLLAACLIEPAMTLDEALAFVTDPEWSMGEVREVVNAAHQINQQARKVDLGKS
ncbi:MAG: hypothetical protein AAGA17_00145 [Actinomycetota bacterium]